MAVAEIFAHGRSVFAFRQRIIVGLPRTRFGLFDAQFLQQFRQLVIDVFRAVIRMETANHKRERIQHGFQYWQ